jgi:hypothetical protein
MEKTAAFQNETWDESKHSRDEGGKFSKAEKAIKKSLETKSKFPKEHAESELAKKAVSHARTAGVYIEDHLHAPSWHTEAARLHREVYEKEPHTAHGKIHKEASELHRDAADMYKGIYNNVLKTAGPLRGKRLPTAFRTERGTSQNIPEVKMGSSEAGAGAKIVERSEDTIQ